MQLSAVAFASAVLFTAQAPGQTTDTRLFIHFDAVMTDEYNQYGVQLPIVCGGQLFLNWSSADSGTGEYDWSGVEQAIAPWSAAGKLVGLAFIGVRQKIPTGSFGSTYQPATPQYVADQVDTVTCKFSDGMLSPPTAVYFEEGYWSNWREFIRAAIAKYQDDPRVAYMRFGIGAADETYPMTGISTSTSPDGKSSCQSLWEKFGMSYSAWTSYSTSLIDYVTSLRPRVLITFDMNTQAPFDEIDSQGNSLYVDTITAEAHKYGFWVGNQGFPNSDKFSYIYEMYGPLTYMQTMSEAQLESGKGGLGAFPGWLADAEGLGIPLYELYPDVFQVAYNPSNSDYAAYGATFRTALEGTNPAFGSACSLRPSRPIRRRP